MEAHLDRLWERGADGLQRYNRLRKVEPMQRALEELRVRTWIAGLRRGQSRARTGIYFLQLRDGRWKLHPLADLTDRAVGTFPRKHSQPYPPLWHRGYAPPGDVHTPPHSETGTTPERS